MTKDNHVSIKVSCFCASSHHKTQKCFGKSQTNDFVLPTEARTREHFCTSFQKGTKHFVLIWRIYCSYSNHWNSLRRGRQFKSLRLGNQRTCLLCLEAQMTFCVLRWFRSISECWLNQKVRHLWHDVYPSVCSTVSHTHTHTPGSSPLSVHPALGIGGLSFAPVAGLRGAAGLPVDSHIRSYSPAQEHNHTGREGEPAASMEYWWSRRAFTKQAQRGLRNSEAWEWILKHTEE